MHLDEFLPEYDFRSHHQVRILASPQQTYAALMASSFSGSRLIRTLMRLRGFGARQLHIPSGPQAFKLALSRGGFFVLSEKPGEELVIGLIGQFWRACGGRFAFNSPAEFVDFRRHGYAKAAWNFLIAPECAGVTWLYTETRVQTLGAAARRRFGLYWSVVAPFSGLIRRSMLEQVRRAAVAAPRSGTIEEDRCN